VYDLSANVRFLIGAMSTAPDPGVLGAASGRAKLQNSTILVHDGGETFSQSGYAGLPLGLHVRDGAVLTLGDGIAGPVRFVPSRGQDAASGPTALTPTTAVSNRVLQKRGEGTLVLRNVGYTDVSETSELYSQFTWMIGRGSAGNNGAAAYFDGAVRGLAPSDLSAAVSNSLLGFWITLRGGVCEIDNSGGGSGTFNRWVSIAAGATNVSIGNVSGTVGLGGGGFAAYGGNVVVDLNLVGTRDTLTWALSNSGFVQGNDPLLFGSQTADANVEFFDNLALAGQVREIRVIDNTNAAGDRATLSGTVSGTGGSALLKSGPGTLVLAASNTYAGGTVVTGGTLLVNAAAGTGTGVVNVASAGTLGGSGTIRGPVVAAGRIRPGDGVGTLFLEQSYTQATGGGLVIEAGGAASAGADYDVLIALGAASLAGNLTVTLTNGYAPASGDTLTVLQAASVAGTFDTTNLPALGGSLAWVVEYQPAAVVLSVTNTGGGPPPPTGYDLAATAITNGLTGYQDDADGDGYANLLEYATGGNLTNADTLARMEGSRTNGLLTLRFLRATNATDATMIVEGSFAATNGALWTGIATNAGGSWGSATNVTETGAGSPVNVNAQDDQPGATNRFLRLRVTRP
jgi:autotransporter-associated beta strand protein